MTIAVKKKKKKKFNPCSPEIDWDYNGWMGKKSKWTWIIVICRIKLAEMVATWFIVVQSLKKASTRKTLQKSSELGMAIVLCMKEHCIMKYSFLYQWIPRKVCFIIHFLLNERRFVQRYNKHDQDKIYMKIIRNLVLK